MTGGIRARLSLGLLGALALAAIAAAPARAAGEHPFLSSLSHHNKYEYACGAATDAYGDLYVAEGEESVVDVYSPTGKLLTEFETATEPCSLAVDQETGDVYVTIGSFPERVVEYQPEGGEYPPSEGTEYEVDESAGEEGVIVEGGEPTAVAVDPATKNLYVAFGASPSHVAEYEPDGEPISGREHIGENVTLGTAKFVGVGVYGVNEYVYLTDQGSNKAYILNPEGTAILTTVTGATNPNFPAGFGSLVLASLAVDQANGNLLVNNTRANAVVAEFTASGAFVSQIGPEFGSDEFEKATAPAAVAVDNGAHSSDQGNVYVTNEASVYAFGPLVAPPEFPLKITVSGEGEVTSSPPGIECTEAGNGGPECEENYEEGKEVELEAEAEEGWEFAGWNDLSGNPGSCTATTSDCELTIEEAVELEAVFVKTVTPEFPLKITVSGEGEVTSSPPGIECTEAGNGGPECEENYEEGKEVELEAEAEEGWEFAGWNDLSGNPGSCTATTSDCELTIEEAVELEAVFVKTVTPEFPLKITVSGEGEVTSSPPGIECTEAGNGGPECEENYEEGKEVELEAEAEEGWEFAGWNDLSGNPGSCTATTSDCELTIEEAVELEAVFVEEAPPGEYSFSVQTGGKGSGAVKCEFGEDGSYEPCPSTPTSYTEGTKIALKAEAGGHSLFAGWSVLGSSSNDCTGTGVECTVTVTAPTTVDATFNLEKFTLSVDKGGTGQGTVVSTSPVSPTIDCGTECAKEFEYGQTVTLKGTPGAHAKAVEWGAGCTPVAGHPEECTVTVTAPTTVDATFNLEKFTLSVDKGGTGQGTVVSTSPVSPTIDCGTECAKEFEYGQTVTLKGTPGAHAKAVEWGAGCTPVAGHPEECTVTVTAPTTVDATFNLEKFTLSVDKGGTGQGTVVSTSPVSPTIDCGTECAKEFEYGQTVTLKGTPGAHAKAVEWGAGCTPVAGHPEECTVTVTAPTTVDATFNLEKFTLSVDKGGTGQGTVVSTSPVSPTIDCGTECAKEFEYGQTVTLKGTPGAHAKAVEWGAGCTPVAGHPEECTVTVTAPTTVDATFNLITHTVEVSVVGEGSVGADTGPISACTATTGTCSGTYDEASSVVLTATPAAHQALSGWSGCESESGPGDDECHLTVNADTQIVARFSPITHTVEVSVVGEGSVGADTGPISACTATTGTCSGTYDEASSVVLTATPAAHQALSGWSGCEAQPSAYECEVTVGSDVHVTATFSQITHPLTVSIAGSGSGSVASSPAGIDCGSACSHEFPEGTAVALTATPAADSEFVAWSGGGCVGAGACQLTLQEATTVTAQFREAPQPTCATDASLCPAPAGTLKVAASAQVKGNAAALAASCSGPGACQGTLKLTAKVNGKSVAIGRATYDVAAGKSATIRVRVTNAGAKRLLKRGKAVKAKLSGAGLSGTVRLKPARKGKK